MRKNIFITLLLIISSPLYALDNHQEYSCSSEATLKTNLKQTHLGKIILASFIDTTPTDFAVISGDLLLPNDLIHQAISFDDTVIYTDTQGNAVLTYLDIVASQ